jgi:hypothetical protein
MSEESNFNKLIIDPRFNETVDEIKKINISLPPNPSQINIDLQEFIFPPNGQLSAPIGNIEVVNMDAQKGQEFYSNFKVISAYDESINKFAGLEGNTYFTSHSLIIIGEEDFLPVNLLTIYFYTRSKEITEQSEQIKYSDDPDVQSKKDYIADKIKFLLQNVPEKSILFIDGPLIGGDYYVLMINAIKQFHEKDIIPIFFVKNSSSNLVIDNTPILTSKYNSDMHWAFKFLKPGQRTNFFVYADKVNERNAKIFTYMKAFNISPQRVEMHIDTYEKYKSYIPQILDMIYYHILVQGDVRNPQIRPIAIAEKYARDTLKLIDFNSLMHGSGLIPTMNQDRFAW